MARVKESIALTFRISLLTRYREDFREKSILTCLLYSMAHDKFLKGVIDDSWLLRLQIYYM